MLSAPLSSGSAAFLSETLTFSLGPNFTPQVALLARLPHVLSRVPSAAGTSRLVLTSLPLQQSTSQLLTRRAVFRLPRRAGVASRVFANKGLHQLHARNPIN